jgi:hypothetical protein
VCSFVCCVLFDRCVILCDVCCLCVIVVPVPRGENPFAVKINNNKKIVGIRCGSCVDPVAQSLKRCLI